MSLQLTQVVTNAESIKEFRGKEQVDEESRRVNLIKCAMQTGLLAPSAQHIAVSLWLTGIALVCI
jgi:hypothetical protein